MAYRPDIDGLRAVAVIAVLLFHAQIISSGYVGVDIFFVISGYLITSQILDQLAAEKFSFRDFYERRIRRLLPALVPVLVFSACVAVAFLDRDDLRFFSRSMLWSTLLSSNIYFGANTGYFDTSAERQPLLHMWSLSIEEQFYLFLPAALFLLSRRRARVVKLALFLAFISSLAWSILVTQVLASDAAFFSSIGRFWELLVGSLMATAYYKALHTPLMRILGCMLIGAALVLFTPTTSFPGLGAVLPVAGAAVLVGAPKRSNDLVSAALSLKAVVYIGRISYSLYLWHWPVIILFKLQFGQLNLTTSSLAILISIAMASISYHTIEVPFRLKKARGFLRPYFGYVAGALAVGGLGTATATLDARDRLLLPRNTQELLSRYEHASERRGRAVRAGICHLGGDQDTESFFRKNRDCLRPDPFLPNYLVLGDSHGADLWLALSRAYPSARFLQLTGDSCRPGAHTRENCKYILEYAAEIGSKDDIRGVILTGRYRADEMAGLVDYVQDLRRRGTQVAVFGPTVEYKLSPKEIIRRERLENAWPEKINRWINPQPAVVQRLLERELKPLGINVISKSDILCAPHGCPIWDEGGQPVHTDYGHWTVEGAQLFAKNLIIEYNDPQKLFVP